MLVNDHRIKGFDGVRAIAVMLVIASHKLGAPDKFGHVGVWLFFALSGFLIVRILARSRVQIEKNGESPINAIGQFFWRRAARLVPIYYILLTVLTLVGAFTIVQGFGPAEAPYYWFHAANFLVIERDAFMPSLGHLWSLAVEEQFYLLMAPLLLLLPRKYTFAACALVVLIGMIAKLALVQESHAAQYVNSLPNFMIIAVGGLFGLAAGRPLPRVLTSGAAQLVTLILFVVIYMAPRPAWLMLGQYIAVLAALFLVQIFQGQHTWFVSLLESAPFKPIGRISYGLYLFQLPIQFYMPRAYGAVLEIALALVLAMLSWRFIEAPILAWARRRQDQSIARPALTLQHAA